MQRAAIPAPPKKRKRGDDEQERRTIKRFLKAIRMRERENARASLRLSNVLGWLNLWQDNAACDYDPGSSTGPHHPPAPPPNCLSPNF